MRARADQIALPFDWPVATSESDFLISEANKAAYEHLCHWSIWPVMASLLTGPRKSGRSLVGQIFVRKTGGRLFDDAEEHDEEDIFHAWNDAQERRKPILIIASAPPPAWDIKLPDLKSRMTATPRVAFAEPDDALIGQLVVKLLGDRGIAAPPELADYLVPRIERTYVAVQQVVDVLDRALLTNRRRMTIPVVREALTSASLIRRARSAP
jgi:hypothetical protein